VANEDTPSPSPATPTAAQTEPPGGAESSPAPAVAGAGPVVPLMVLRIGQLWLAVPVEHVEEVAPQVEPSPVPLAPPHIPGLINQRGQAVPLLDLRVFLGLRQEVAEGSALDQSFRRIVVLSAEGMRVGIPCDQVRGVIEAPSGQMRPVEGVQGERLREFSSAQLGTESLLLVLDVPRLLLAARVSA